jgi:transcriptional regulator with XRE-family HTH domain
MSIHLQWDREETERSRSVGFPARISTMPSLLMLGATIDQLVARFGIGEAQFASALGVSPKTVERWRSDESVPQIESRRRLEALIALDARLQETFTSPDGAVRWLHSDSGYFGGLKPVDALVSGRIELVDAALEAIDSGIFV